MLNLKVAFFATTSNMDSGASWSLLRMIINLHKNGITPIVFLQKHGNIEEKLNAYNIKYYVIPEYCYDTWIRNIGENINIKYKCKQLLKKYINFVSYLKIKKIVKEEKVNLIHLNGLPTFLGAKVAKNSNIKLVWHIREFMGDDLGLEFVNNQEAKNLISESNAIVVVSNAVGRSFNNFVKNPNKIHVVYNGLEVEKYYKKRKIFSDSNSMIISIIGRLVPQKGQLDLLKAVKYLKDNVKKNTTINIIGASTSYLNVLKKYSKENSLNVNFINYTSHIETYMQKSDVICVCSKKEAFGRVTIEGMLSGACVVGSRSGGTPELIDDSINGYLYGPNNLKELSNILEHIYTNQLEAQRVAEKGQLFAKNNFTDKKNAQNILSLYKKIM